jgi:hypothetical protein
LGLVRKITTAPTAPIGIEPISGLPTKQDSKLEIILDLDRSIPEVMITKTVKKKWSEINHDVHELIVICS